MIGCRGAADHVASFLKYLEFRDGRRRRDRLSRPDPSCEGNLLRIEHTGWCFSKQGPDRWRGRAGPESEPSTNAIAKVKAHFRFDHRKC